jgi:Uma2 family endonuclease
MERSYIGFKRGVRMATAALVPLSEYLQTTYHPDCEWVKGELRERSVPQLSHASVQRFFTAYFTFTRKKFGVRVYPELRMRVAEDCIRVPDVMVMRDSDPADEIVVVAPLLCIEVLSPEDRMSEIQEKVDEYLDMGVNSVWVVDPRRRKAFQTDGRSLRPVEVLTVPDTLITIPLSDVFEELNELKGRA